MVNRPCPTCGHATPRPLAVNAWALVNYYRCDLCGCVWMIPKWNLLAEPTIVAQGRKVDG